MNSVYLSGNLAADPQLRTSVNGRHYVYFTVANNMKSTKNAQTYTSFIGCVAWGKTAESICSVLHKGSRIWIDNANIVVSDYTDKQGQRHYDMRVQVYRFDFVSSESKQQASSFSDMGEEFTPNVPF